MKKFAIVSVFTGLIVAMYAYAVEPVVCAIPVTVGTTTTQSPFYGSCLWANGATVLMQCTNDGGTTGIDVFVTSSVDAGAVYPTAASPSTGQLVQFTTNSDPYILYLGTREQIVSVYGTTLGMCKFSPSPRRHPY